MTGEYSTLTALFVLLRQLVTRKEIAQLEARRLFRIRSVNRIGFDAGRMLLANSSVLGFGRIRRAHEFAEIGDGVFLLQREHNNRAR